MSDQSDAEQRDAPPGPADREPAEGGDIADVHDQGAERVADPGRPGADRTVAGSSSTGTSGGADDADGTDGAGAAAGEDPGGPGEDGTTTLPDG